MLICVNTMLVTAFTKAIKKKVNIVDILLMRRIAMRKPSVKGGARVIGEGSRGYNGTLTLNAGYILSLLVAFMVISVEYLCTYV